jgi:CheY-like chemotaxis protein
MRDSRAQPFPPTALRVLVVDDNADVAESLGIILEMHGYRVLTCLHPDEALTVAPAFAPEVCILDIGLPGMSGHELAQALRAAGLTRSTYIAVTGYGSIEARKASRAAGFAMHLTKPVDPRYLLGKLSSIREARATDDLGPKNGWVGSLRVAS